MYNSFDLMSRVVPVSLTYDDIQIMPTYSEIESRKQCDLSTKFTKNWSLRIPIVSAPMDTVTGFEMAKILMDMGGVGIIHRFNSIDVQSDLVSMLKIYRNDPSLPICAAIGVTGDYKERAEALVASGVDVILIDVAHGNTKLTRDTIEFIKNTWQHIDVIAGNICSYEGAANLESWGADATRVGIGGGSMCETRIRTGIGIPQVTAIYQSRKGSNIPLIADGGIKTPGDVAKALALGADTVMLGSLLAGTEESPGRVIRIGKFPNEQEFKNYRGSASLETKMAHSLSDSNIEGNSTMIPFKGPVTRIIHEICDGVRSAMSYCNALTLEEFSKNAKFVQITQNGVTEAHPHGMR